MLSSPCFPFRPHSTVKTNLQWQPWRRLKIPILSIPDFMMSLFFTCKYLEEWLSWSSLWKLYEIGFRDISPRAYVSQVIHFLDWAFENSKLGSLSCCAFENRTPERFKSFKLIKVALSSRILEVTGYREQIQVITSNSGRQKCWASWTHFPPPPTSPPFPTKQCWYFFDFTDHSTYTALNWGAGDIRKLTLDANKIEQMLNYRKSSFPESVSATFVAHCSH